MPTFEFRARDQNGEMTTGTLTAESEKAVLNTLNKQGLFPVDIKSVSETRVQTASSKAFRKISKSEVITFTRELADLLNAGLPINKALSSIREHTANGNLQKIIHEIHKDISQGSALSRALSRHPKLFPDFYIGMIKAGEEGGFLDESLERIALFSERDEEIKSKIKAALAYPILLMIIGSLTIVFLMTFFIPRFSAIFKDFGKTLPEITLITISVSEFLRDYFLLIIASIFGISFLHKYLNSLPQYRLVFDRLRLRLPILGELIHKRSLALFTRTLGTLLKSGVPIIESLVTAKDAVSNTILKQNIEEAGAGLKRGIKLGQALKKFPYFPVTFTDAIQIGEESGKLETVLINSANSYDAQVDRLLKTFIALFEPILIVFMAAIVGFVVISMLLPIFTLSTIVR